MTCVQILCKARVQCSRRCRITLTAYAKKLVRVAIDDDVQRLVCVHTMENVTYNQDGVITDFEFKNTEEVVESSSLQLQFTM